MDFRKFSHVLLDISAGANANAGTAMARPEFLVG
jgi:hypothetical protein